MTERRNDGKDGKTERRKDGKTERRKDGKTERRKDGGPQSTTEDVDRCRPYMLFASYRPSVLPSSRPPVLPSFRPSTTTVTISPASARNRITPLSSASSSSTVSSARARAARKGAGRIVHAPQVAALPTL